MAQLALAWVLRLPNVASAIIGASRPEQVHENAAASGVTLSADVLEAIDAALRRSGDRWLRMSQESDHGTPASGARSPPGTRAGRSDGELSVGFIFCWILFFVVWLDRGACSSP